jgi:LytR cell envelope-related transcriptional attenuator
LLGIAEETGAAAGLMAIVGVAALSVVYVSHARDVKRLREWAGPAPELSARTATGVPRRRRIGIRNVAIGLAGLLVLVLVLGGAAAHNGHKSTRPKHIGAVVKPGNVTVAVLNGTTVPGLAATLRNQLAAAGFKKGTINDFPDKQLAASVVEYAPGHEAEAKAVSRTVGISNRLPVTERSHALAGDATVIVIAGADKGP